MSDTAACQLLLDAANPMHLGQLRWGDMVEAMLQLMQVRNSEYAGKRLHHYDLKLKVPFLAVNLEENASV